MTDSLHIHHGQEHPVPLPVTFYLSEEIVADEGIAPEYIAEILQDDVVFAITFYRLKLKGETDPLQKARDEIARLRRIDVDPPSPIARAMAAIEAHHKRRMDAMGSQDGSQ
jgi:hypothetical protein